MGRTRKALPEAYKEDFDVRMAVADLRRIEMLDSDDAVQVGLHQDTGLPAGRAALQALPPRPALPDPVLPLFTHLGVEVIDERPYEITRSDGVRVYIFDFGLRTRQVEQWGVGDDRDVRRLRFQDAFRAVWTGARSPTASTRSSSVPG